MLLGLGRALVQGLGELGLSSLILLLLCVLLAFAVKAIRWGSELHLR